jgi:hypothetical protein
MTPPAASRAAPPATRTARQLVQQLAAQQRAHGALASLQRTAAPSTRGTMSSARRRLAPISAHLSAAAGSDGAELAVGVDAAEADVADMADAHLIQPYDKLDRPNTSMIQSSGRGIYLITDKGEEIIDGPGGMWNVNVGYGEARLAEAIGTQVRASA